MLLTSAGVVGGGGEGRDGGGLNPRPPGLQSNGASNWATEADQVLGTYQTTIPLNERNGILLRVALASRTYRSYANHTSNTKYVNYTEPSLSGGNYQDWWHSSRASDNE